MPERKKTRGCVLGEMLWKTATTGRRVHYILIDTYSTSAFWYAYLASQSGQAVRIKDVAKSHRRNLPNRLAQVKTGMRPVVQKLIRKCYCLWLSPA